MFVEALAQKEEALRREEARRLRAERVAHDAIVRSGAVDEIAAIGRKEQDRLKESATTAASTIASSAADRERIQRDIYAQKLELQQQQRDAAAGGATSHKLILIMTVEMGDGRAENIRVYDDSDPDQLAAQFVVMVHINIFCVVRRCLGLLSGGFAAVLYLLTYSFTLHYSTTLVISSLHLSQRKSALISLRCLARSLHRLTAL